MGTKAASLGQLAVRARVIPVEQCRRLRAAVRARARAGEPMSLGRMLVKGGLRTQELRDILRSGADLDAVACDGCGELTPQADLPRRREYACDSCGALFLPFAPFLSGGGKEEEEAAKKRRRSAGAPTQAYAAILPVPNLDQATPTPDPQEASTVAFDNPEGETIRYDDILLDPSEPVRPDYIYELPSGIGQLSEEETVMAMAKVVRESDDAAPTPRIGPAGVSNRALADNVEPEEDGSVRLQLDQREIGGFKLLRSLGRGAVGRVFLAQEPATGRKVALKVLRSSASNDEEVVKRFEREARVSGLVEHPNVVEKVASGVDPRLGARYLALEFLEGGSLLDLLRESERVPQERALRITRGVCLALQAAEAHRIVHRDIKPENILFSLDGTPKLADLGLAKVMEAHTQITETGFVVGTPCYIAPEQATGDEDVDIRADVFSLGFCLWQMLTGLVPFSDDDDAAPMDVIIRHLEEDLPDPRLYAHTVSDGAAQIVRGMTARDRASRYGSPAHVVRDIDLVLEGSQPLSSSDASLPQPLTAMVEELRSSASRAIPPTVEAPAPSAPQPAPPRTTAPSSGGSRAGWIVLGLLTLVAFGTLGAWAALWIRYWLRQG
jgi:serine/threonine protein kinase